MKTGGDAGAGRDGMRGGIGAGQVRTGGNSAVMCVGTCSGWWW